MYEPPSNGEAMTILGYLISAVATLPAAFFGAWFAFKLQSDKEKKAARERNLTAGNLAIYKVGRMWLAVHNYEKNFVQPIRQDPLAFITLRSSQRPAIDWGRLDYDKLAFLFSENHRNVIPELTGVENNFHALFQDIDYRSKLREGEVYDALESNGLAHTAPPHIEDLERTLGPKLFQTMVNSTKRIISTVDSLQTDLSNVQEKLISVLAEVFPEANVIRYLPPKPEDV